MDKFKFDLDEAAVIQRLDRSSPDALIKSIASEFIRLQRVQAHIAAQLAVFGSLQAVADRIAAAEQEAFSISYPSRVSIDADDSFQGASGFYGLEHDSDGNPYRWSGPNPQFSFQFFVDRRRPAKFFLDFGQFFTDAPLEGLQCFVDGELADLTIRSALGGFEATGIMAARGDYGGSVLTFVCPTVQSPQAQGSDDERMLGLLFRRLCVETEAEGPVREETSLLNNLETRRTIAKVAASEAAQ